MNKFYLILISLIISGCGKENELIGLRAGGFNLANSDQQSAVLRELNKSGIPFKVTDGRVWYLQKDVAEVRRIKRRITMREDASPYDMESEVAVSELHLEIYKRSFENAGVPYTVKSGNGYFNIQWRVTYAEKVDQIVEDVGFEFYEISTNN